MRRLLKAMRSEKGFTLIELLVVIGILAMLAGVVTLAVTQFVGRGQQEACATDLHNVQTAVAACMVEVAAGRDTTDCTSVSALVGTYLLDTPLGTYTVDSSGRVNQEECP